MESFWKRINTNKKIFFNCFKRKLFFNVSATYIRMGVLNFQSGKMSFVVTSVVAVSRQLFLRDYVGTIKYRLVQMHF